MNNVSQGYGSAEDMMAPRGDQLASQEAPVDEAPEGEGGDMEAMISEGVQAYLESQDPEVAVQVVMMLAEAMGLGEGGDPAGAPPAGNPAEQAPAPMAKNGGKFGWFGNEGEAANFQKFVSK